MRIPTVTILSLSLLVDIRGFVIPIKSNKRVSSLLVWNSIQKEAHSTTTKKATKKKKPPSLLVPWRANYMTSKQMQTKLQKAASNVGRNKKNQNPIVHVLTLLLQNENRCNESNIVCALTLTAKLVTRSSNYNDSRARKMIQTKLEQVLDILERECLIPKRLQTRQLCNVAWALAKIYDADPALLGIDKQGYHKNSNTNKNNNNRRTYSTMAISEEWDLSSADDDSHQHHSQVWDIMNNIAQQLTDIMTIDQQKLQPKKGMFRQKLKHPPKTGELNMVSWAYAIFYPREKPPGWELPPRKRITTTTSTTTKPLSNQSKNGDIVKFEQLISSTTSSHNDESQNSKTNHPVFELFDAIADTLITKDYVNQDVEYREPLLQCCSWKELANIAWAFATHGHTSTLLSETLMIHLAKEATIRLEDNSGKKENFLPRDVSQIVWALGTAQSDNYHISDALVHFVDSISHHWIVNNKSSRPFRGWKHADLVQLATSLAHGRIDNTGLLEGIFLEALVSMNNELDDDSEKSSSPSSRNFQSWELAVLLWTQARLYLTTFSSPIYSQFASKVPQLLMKRLSSSSDLNSIGLKSQEQANLAWSLTVLEQTDDEHSQQLLQYIFQTAANDYYYNNDKEKKVSEIQLEHAHQLWQAYYLVKDSVNSRINIPQPLEDYLQQQWKLEKNRRKTSSARHTSLSKTLNLMGVAHYNEHEEDIDVAIVLNTESCWTHTADTDDVNNDRCHHKVAVEFDGPSHFVRAPSSLLLDSAGASTTTNNNQLRVMGHTVLKYRMLKKQGWTVVRVPYYEYDKIPFWASMERQRYLQRLLKTHANIRFSAVDVSEYKAIVHNRQSRFD